MPRTRPTTKSFEHTHISVYIVGLFAVACVFYDSTQGIIQKYEINKKWFYLYGAIIFFAYLYLRPLIRRTVGSASRGYINFYSVYIAWLCSAVFLHLPGFQTLGIDVKTDLSILLAIFLLSLVALTVMHGLYALGAFLKVLTPSLYNPTAGRTELLSIVFLNSMNLAVACSTYYSFCGNAGGGGQAWSNSLIGDFKAAVCQKWLHPVGSSSHPAFSRWVIYGEAAGHKEPDGAMLPYINVDIPFDGLGLVGMPAADVISPVFTLWITLVLLYMVNSMADYQAARVMKAAHTSELRKAHGSSSRRRARRSRRRRSADFYQEKGNAADLARRISLEMMTRSQSTQLPLHGMGGLLRTVSQGLQGHLLNTGGGRGSLDLQGSLPLSSKGSISKWPSQGLNSWQTGPGMAKMPSQLSRGLPNVQEAEPAVQPARASFDGAEAASEDAPQPNFLPMFPWYSGTSADMYRTIFDLLVSLKLFLGRYDMRTMQAATAGVPPGGGRDPPREGDGFTFEHLAAKDQLWMDFAADTGDGGDPTYSVARAMAAPLLHVTVPPAMSAQIPVAPLRSSASAPEPAKPSSEHSFYEDADSPRSLETESSSGLDTPRVDGPAGSFPGPNDGPANVRVLPRGDVLILGGDLAYPNPSNETYELRFFRPFEAALPPPPHVHPGRLVVNKPDLPLYEDMQLPTACHCPPSGCAQHSSLGGTRHTGDLHCRSCAAAEALRRYDGPTCFAIPGNHDWIDGLETFQRHIQHKGWLGGWLLPQEKSYFALRLPHGWWLFGLDLALVEDIDMCQCRYFARIADERMGPDDQVILVTHQPHWLTDWFAEEASCHNLRQLIRAHLRGRARVHLAGDLHFYMRHSFKPSAPAPKPSNSDHLNSVDAMQPTSPGASSFSQAASVNTPLGTSPDSARSGLSVSFARSGRVTPLGSSPTGSFVLGGKSRLGGPHLPSIKINAAASTASSVGEQSRASSIISSDDLAEIHNMKEIYQELAEVLGADANGPAVASAVRGNLHPYDPEHLIVNGLGGAFLHPTHVFANARFASIPDPAADAAFVRGSLRKARTPKGDSPKGGSPKGGSPRGGSPRGGSPRISRRVVANGEVGVGKLGANEGADVAGGGGEFRCMAAYPSPERSTQLGRQNIHVFRLKNTRFDVIGGALYFMLVVSMLPRCTSVSAIVDAHNLPEAIAMFFSAAADAIVALFSESYLSLAALGFMFVMSLGFARSGGIGATSDNSAALKSESFCASLTSRARSGGVLTQVVFAGMHTGTHLAAAIIAMVLLELGVETCIRYESIGKEGYHSLYRDYLAFEAQHFPDPMGVRVKVARFSCNLYPGVIKIAMAVFDVPEAIAVARSAICSAGSIAGLTRLQASAYYLGMLAYYWVLVTPAVAFIFGCYLYICVNWFHVHYDEAFSSLRIPHYKGFSRIHINTDGDLEIYGLAMDKVPCQWREDPRWRGPVGGGRRLQPSHKAEYPSRWLPVLDRRRFDASQDGADGTEVKAVDYLVVPKKRPPFSAAT
ncbi:hypothetical protein WJX72_006230 [[Myrmecia] bisecta]|uniref:Calcineurin-like phosphoesterase domain-containing protein n=1 Tax=[Myrmecia] bisecta TaxID=41462 RepID=A0AAW1QR14_9CHLO